MSQIYEPLCLFGCGPIFTSIIAARPFSFVVGQKCPKRCPWSVLMMDGLLLYTSTSASESSSTTSKRPKKKMPTRTGKVMAKSGKASTAAVSASSRLLHLHLKSCRAAKVGHWTFHLSTGSHFRPRLSVRRSVFHLRPQSPKKK